MNRYHISYIRDVQKKGQSLKRAKRFVAALAWKNLHVLLAKRLEK